MRILCPNCRSANVRTRVRGASPTGEPRDHVVQVQITCPDCERNSDVTDEVARVEAAGDEVVIGAHRLRRTVER